MSVVLKYAIANVQPANIAGPLQEQGFSGSVTQGFGFGLWGMEPTTFVELSLGKKLVPSVDHAVAQVLFKHKEECAYRTLDGMNAALLYSDGRVVSL